MATATAVTLGWEQVLALRVRRHLLAAPASAEAGRPSTPADLATRLCGLHAQVASCAELAVAVRAAQLVPSDVTAALARRDLVKTWMMRGTLHLFAATDLPLYSAAGRTRRGHLTASWLRYQRVSQADLDAIMAAIPQALAGAELTREELAAAVARLTRRPALEALLRSGWGDLLKPSAYRGDLCFGSGRGRNITFVRPQDWITARWDGYEPAAALREVARRYLATFGPASREDFGRWWGCQPAEAGRVFAALADEVAQVEVGGWRALVLRDDLDELLTAARPRGPQVSLLPGFDPYVVGACPRAHAALLPDGRKDDIYRAQGWVSAVLLSAGRMVGVWRSEAARSRVTMRLEAYEPLNRTTRAAFAAEATRVGRLLGGDADLTWTAP